MSLQGPQAEDRAEVKWGLGKALQAPGAQQGTPTPCSGATDVSLLSRKCGSKASGGALGQAISGEIRSLNHQARTKTVTGLVHLQFAQTPDSVAKLWPVFRSNLFSHGEKEGRGEDKEGQERRCVPRQSFPPSAQG